MKFEDLSTVNALLNLLSFFFLINGYRKIKSGNREAHRTSMIAALATSGLFLISYLVYHAKVGSVPFMGEGWSRPVYFTILISHIVLAAAIVPMVIMTVLRAFKENFELHKKIARKTFPIWVYVSVTGVVVYLMVYHLFK